jgi:hypothetical protein
MSDGVVDDYPLHPQSHARPGGMAFWANTVQHGGRDEDLLASLAGSDEYHQYTQVN